MRMSVLVLFALLGGFSGIDATAQSLPNLFPFPNESGFLETFNVSNKPIDLTGPFFQSLGTNGRSCSSCHRPAQGWSVSPNELKLRFLLTQGTDPIFRTNDGSNCDHGIDTSSVQGRRQAYSLLLSRGLLRIALGVPANAEFRVVSVRNPYGCDDQTTLSMYRRPLPATNLRFLSAVMWDGRESSYQTSTQPITYASNPADLRANLAHQAKDATLGHAQGTISPSDDQLSAIVNFEMNLATAQAYDYIAGSLNSNGALGGPTEIGTTTMPGFFVGTNDPLGGNPSGAPFTPLIFNLFDAWEKSQKGFGAARRASIARGQAVFNSKPFNITGVAGLNDDLHLYSIPGTCGICHDTPNVGDHSLPVALNIGVADMDSPLDVSYLPVITLENISTHEMKVTTDPGRALITGLWKDVGKVKGPVLRGLAARPPYFHNGSAASLSDVIDFYEKRFNIGFTVQEKQDLIAFLNSL